MKIESKTRRKKVEWQLIDPEDGTVLGVYETEAQAQAARQWWEEKAREWTARGLL